MTLADIIVLRKWLCIILFKEMEMSLNDSSFDLGVTYSVRRSNNEGPCAGEELQPATLNIIQLPSNGEGQIPYSDKENLPAYARQFTIREGDGSLSIRVFREELSGLGQFTNVRFGENTYYALHRVSIDGKFADMVVPGATVLRVSCPTRSNTPPRIGEDQMVIVNRSLLSCHVTLKDGSSSILNDDQLEVLIALVTSLEDSLHTPQNQLGDGPHAMTACKWDLRETKRVLQELTRHPR